MKKLLLTLATLALIAPLGACSKADAKGSEQPSSSEPAPTAADLIQNIAIGYGTGVDNIEIDSAHLTHVLPKKQHAAPLDTTISVKGEDTPRVVTATYSLVGEYDDTKVDLDDGWLLVKGATSFTLKTAFHFADTNEDVEKQFTVSWTLPSTHIIEINSSNYGDLSNYGLTYNELNPSAIAEGTPEGVMLQMSNSGSYGWSCHTALSYIRSVTIEFERLGVFSSVQAWGSKNWGSYTASEPSPTNIKVNATREDVVENKLTLDFSEKLVEFDGSDYYLKLWFWNDGELGEGQSSLVKSISFEVAPSM